MWGSGQGEPALRHAATIAGVSRRTLWRWAVWLDADARDDTAKVRAVGSVLPGRRSIPRGADPR